MWFRISLIQIGLSPFFGRTPLVAASKSLKMQILILPFEGKIERSTGL